MTASSPILVAVDGGGTGCRAAVGTIEQGVLGEASGGPSNINNSFEGTLANVTAAARAALVNAGFSPDDLARCTAHLGLAGADTADIRAAAMAELPFGTCTVTGDRDTSVVGVLGPQDGFVIALGTGTIIATQKAGVIRTVNGWGFEVSDHASGAWLGHALIREVVLSEDGMAPRTPLCEQISAELGGLAGLVAFGQRARPSDYAPFAKPLFEAARKQDETALSLLRAGAQYLHTGLRVLGFGQGDVLCLSGGVGPHYLPYLDSMFTQNMKEPQGKALDGAFTLARLAAERAEG